MKGVAEWMWIIGGVIVAIVVLTLAYDQILKSQRTRIEQMSIDHFNEIASNLDNLCWEFLGNKRELTIELGDMVEGIYAANSPSIEYEKVQLINNIVQNENSTGNYLCLKISNKRLYCENFTCNVTFPFIGYVPEQFSLTALINSLMGRGKIYTYSIIMRREPDGVNVFFSGFEPTSTTLPTTTTSISPNKEGDVLIVALKSNMKRVYSDTQITTLENKIKEFIQSLNQDNLDGTFLYLDGEETSNLIGSNVTKPTDWNDVDGILDQVVQKLKAKYVLIVGGYDRFPSPKVSGYYTDNPYADYTKDNVPDVALGRLPEPNDGDMDLFMTAFDTFIRLHIFCIES